MSFENYEESGYGLILNLLVFFLLLYYRMFHILREVG